MRKNLRYFLLPLSLLLSIMLVNVLLPPITTEKQLTAIDDFHTTTLTGQKVTNEIFAGKFTLLVIWQTKDDNNRELLQNLATLQTHEQSPLQIIGLVSNVSEDDEAAITALGPKLSPISSIPQLLVNDDFAPLLATIKTTPTICFINSFGQLIGQPLAAHDLNLIKKEARRLLATDSQDNIDKSPIMKKLSPQ